MLGRIWHSAKIRLNRPPQAYRPGSLLKHLRSDLAAFDFELLAADRAIVRTADLQVEIQEIVESQFLMHVVSSEFSCRFSTATPVPMTVVSARHRGAWRRTGVEFIGKDPSLVARLAEYAPLLAALKDLDFTQWRLESCDSGWRLTLRHFGASEVVGHMPAFRRYVRLERAQCDALLASMRAVGALLS